MNTDRWLFVLALCFMCVSSNDEEDFANSCEDVCETLTLRAPLGSSVLLPCHFSTSSWVSWVHSSGKDLIKLKSVGHINFLDHRYGRVKAFPNQGSEGNYSIIIDDLQKSDLGCYQCKQGRECVQAVKVITGSLSKEVMLVIYICVGVAVLVLLGVSTYGCITYIFSGICNEGRQEHMNNPADAGVIASTQATGSVPVGGQQRGADNLVYENDDQAPAYQQGDSTRNPFSLPEVLPDPDRTQPTQSIYPSLKQCNFERVESQRNKKRIHTELFSRIRQASLTRHFYANQSEIRIQQAMSTQAENCRRGGHRRKKDKENCDYKNPIYNRSIEQLTALPTVENEGVYWT